MKDVESTRYSQRALFFALFLSCVQPAISQTTPATVTCGGNCGPGCTPSSGATSGTITDDPDVAYYYSDSNCWWLIATSPGDEIRISFTEFETDPNYDWVVVQRCSDASCSAPTEILRQSGSHPGTNGYSSSTGFLKVIFTSDDSFSASGWTLTWTTLQLCLCVSGYTGPDGGTCTACAAGTYKSVTGSAACTNCAAGKSAAAGASACTICAAGWYGLPVADGLVGLNSNIARSRLEEWTAQGVSGWKMGSVGESCSTACINSGLSCYPLVISGGEASAILASLGWQLSQELQVNQDSHAGV